MYINGYKLDESQMNAIKSDADATLVVAGAGSGKTLTIMGLIKYLIEELNYKENEILAISFTNATVISLHEKLLELGYDINVKTFHKLSLSLIDKDYSIINDNYLEYIIDEYFKSYIKYSRNKINLNRVLYTNKKIDNILDSYEYIKLKRLISTFIRLLKSNNLDHRYIYRVFSINMFNKRRILKFILDIYIIYKRELESMKKIDFDDLISIAKENVKNNKLNYKYIIIDEFQDTSKVRFDLIKEIIKYTKSKLFCVGDDYQSIYRFSGCNLDIFLNFQKYFSNSKIFQLTNTYRNSNELIKVSTSFIMKNKKQLKKKIKSNKDLDKPIVICFNLKTENIIKKINSNNLMILGRNNKDIENINHANKYTIHRSKGLEEENVLLVNSDNIPSKLKTPSLLKYVMASKDYIIYEEERRLFYVALTRTKNKIYIQVNKHISPFVKELIKDYKKYIEIWR